MKFSERYGYVKPVDVLKKGSLDKEGEIALCNCFDHLHKWLNEYDMRRIGYDKSYASMEETIWCFFMNQRRDDFYTGRGGHVIVATEYMLSDEYKWYLKFDLIEYAIQVLRRMNKNDQFHDVVNLFVNIINATFKRLSYAYRIVDDQIVEITDDEEIKAVEEAIVLTSAINTHLSASLKHLSDRPDPDYRNSIKESISAVEALCREITGETTLGSALNKLEKNGVKIPAFLKSGFEKLYVYTNNDKTGIRHALMDDADAPGYDEAKFMLVACCAFINYVQGKRSK